MNANTDVYWVRDDPVPTVFDIDRGGVSVEQALAFRDLLAAGLHPVLCTWDKNPLWPDWQHRRPSFDDIVHHDGPIGHIPGKLNPGLVVFDVDDGTPDAIWRFCRSYPPLLRASSRRPGGAHLYYEADGEIMNARFVGPGVSGDVRGATGYVILWHGAVIRLRDVLRKADGKQAPAPLHLIVDQQAGASAGSGPHCNGSRGGRRSNSVASLEATSSPNPRLFDCLRHWAYETSEGTDRASWRQQVLEESRRQNSILGHPLPAREVEGMAARVADWVWERRSSGGASARSRGKDPSARRDGLASGRARRRGTPLEHDRVPWVALRCSRATYYRNYRYLQPGQAPSQRPRPWIALGISNDAFRQRVKRARAGTYRGASRGVPPWESVGISEEEWRRHYANSEPLSAAGVVDAPETFCHGSETEPSIGWGGGGGWRYPPLAGQGLCDPVQSAEILMEVVAAYQNDPAPSSQRRSVAAQPPTVGVGNLEAAKSVAAHISEMRTKMRSALVRDSQECAVGAYLDSLDVPYRAALVRRGLPVHSLRRPRHAHPQYDPMNPEHRRRLARQGAQDHAHDLRTATPIYEREQCLGTAPEVPPWERARAEAKVEVLVKGWHASAEDRRLRREAERARWEFIIATEYRPTLTVAEPAVQAYGLAA